MNVVELDTERFCRLLNECVPDVAMDGVSIGAFAETVGVTERTLYRMQKPGYRTSLTTADKVAVALNVHLDSLIRVGGGLD